MQGTLVKAKKRIELVFYASPTGNEPVREWLLALVEDDRRIIGNDLATLEYGWPIGMPICAQLSGSPGLWECRSQLKSRRIARVFFVVSDGHLVALHGFIKKTQKTPESALRIAKRRMKEVKRYG